MSLYIGLLIIILIALYMKKGNKRNYIIIIGFIVAMILILSSLYDLENTYLIFVNPYLLIALIILVYELGVVLYKKIRNTYYSVDIKRDLNSLQREIDMEYNPSIVGYLFKQKLYIEDLSADILNLFANKIINIEKNEENKYIIKKGDKYNEKLDYLPESDLYLLDCLKKDEDINFEKWQQEVKRKYDSLEFSSKQQHMSDKKMFLIIILTVIISTIILKIFLKGILKSFVGGILIALVVVFVINASVQSKNKKDIILTEKGKKEFKKCLKLKKFMTEYTLLGDRSVEEINIFESYIPYAIALGVNKVYKNTIYDIFDKEELKNIMGTIRKSKYEI